MISIQHLDCAFGTKQVLSDICADIEQGGMYALMGLNGCGKTTLLRCIGNLLQPQRGAVLVGGTDIRRYTTRQLARQISMVRQHSHTDFEFSAFETVLMGRNPYQRRLQNESRRDWAIVERCMRLTHTWEHRLSKPHEMSGGEWQRVMIARALAQDTPVMLFDEPTSNLDIAHQFEIMELLSDINRSRRKTILIVMHDLNLAYRYCPSLLLLHNRRIHYQGPMHDGLTPATVRQVFGIDYPFLHRSPL
ncbi:MAG: iron complex transport system ATP-binding protein [bacterium P3]|nr:MAG: iron complex transport system ATP-binding protein [bacterium P3]KWW40095.1 MAG: iron complex transport system ATP-binding protein [bacterium F083]